jgi:hypothetical protein
VVVQSRTVAGANQMYRHTYLDMMCMLPATVTPAVLKLQAGSGMPALMTNCLTFLHFVQA